MNRSVLTMSWKGLLASVAAGLLVCFSALPAAAGKAAPEPVSVLDPASGTAVLVTALPAARVLELKPGGIQGVVTDSSGSPLAKLQIELLDPATGKTVQKIKTNKDGEYNLKNLREGRYVMLVGSPGVAAILDVSLKAKGTPASINIVVPAAATAEQPKGAPEPLPLPVLASVSTSTDKVVVLVGGLLVPAASEPAAAAPSTSPVPPAPAGSPADNSSTRAGTTPVRPPPVKPPLPPVLSPGTP